MNFTRYRELRFVLPLLAFLMGAIGGRVQARAFVIKSDSEQEASERKSQDKIKELRFYRSLSNVAWVMGPEAAVDSTLSLEQRHLGLLDKGRSVELSIRRALITSSLEGQAAILSGACSQDAGLCDRLAERVQGVADTRMVAPGNQLPEAITRGLPVSPGAYPPSRFHKFH